jgi:hypothetical protein
MISIPPNAAAHGSHWDAAVEGRNFPLLPVGRMVPSSGAGQCGALTLPFATGINAFVLVTGLTLRIKWSGSHAERFMRAVGFFAGPRLALFSVATPASFETRTNRTQSSLLQIRRFKGLSLPKLFKSLRRLFWLL